MKTKIILLSFVMLAGFAFRAQAQDKVAYANIQLILNYMPETKSMAQTIQTTKQMYEKKLEPRYKIYQQKRIELEEWAQANPNATQEQAQPKIDELQRLEKEIQQESAKAEQALAKKQQDLMEPITEKLQNAVKAIANEEGYTVVLNTQDGSGVSIVLYGPEDRDLTIKIMKKLGIKVPEGSDGK
ncbi:MAG: OmpH family outer membrane protein [Bacteroidia bacterium]